MSVTEPPLNPTPEAIVQIAIEKMQARYPNWNPNPSSPEFRMFLAFAGIASETIILGYSTPEEMIRTVGETVYQIAPEAPTQAEVNSTWTALDTAGYEIEAGEPVIITPLGKSGVAFEVKEKAVIPHGSNSVVVKLVSSESGEEFNGISGTAVSGGLLSWISSIVINEESHGGENGETLQQYANRIVELAKIVAPRPILPEDFANYVRLSIPGVYRAVGIDEYNAETSETGQERCVTTAVMNSSGGNCTEAELVEARELLKKSREASFKSFVVNPTRHAISVTVVGLRASGWEAIDVRERTKRTIENYLASVSWGVPQSGDAESWVNTETLRYQEMTRVVLSVEGFDHYTELKVNGAESNVTLTGVAPLTEPGTISVSVT